MTTAVRIRGPFTGPTGYDHHVREFVRAFAKRDVAVQLIDNPDWGPSMPHQLRDPWFETLTAPVSAQSIVHFSFPNHVPVDDSLVKINFTMFEADRIHPTWAAAHGASDLIVLPTEHCRQIWAASGVPEAKLRLCPLGVRADLFRPGVRPLPLGDIDGRPIASRAVRFLNVSEIGPRKNLEGLFTAWFRATTPADDAVLVLKLGSYSPGSLENLGYLIENAEENAHKRREQAAPFHFVHDILPDVDMPRLFAAATHYVSLSLGEGWDLSMIEAAATGLKLIAPRHTAYLSYLDDSIASMVSCRPIRADLHRWHGELFEGAYWWLPDEDEAVQRIRSAIDGHDDTVASARERVAERYTWDNAASRLLEIVAEADAMAEQRRRR